MTKAIYLTLGGSVIASFFLLGGQRQKISELRAGNEVLRSASQGESHAVGKRDASLWGERGSRNSLNQGIKGMGIRLDFVNRSEASLRELVESASNMKQDPSAGIRAIPVILEAVEELNSDELFEVFRKLSDAGLNQGNGDFVKMIVGALIAESSPLKILNGKFTNQFEIKELKSSAWNSLLKKDFAAGKAWYAANVDQLSISERRNFDKLMSLNLMRSDPGEAVIFLAKLPRSNHMNVPKEFGVLAMDVEKRKKLIEALKDQNHAVLNQEVSRALFVEAFVAGNKAAFQDAVKGIDLTEEARYEMLKNSAQRAIDQEGVNRQEIANWLKETVTGDQGSKVMSRVVTAWAENDIKAAGEWLQKQEASQIKDGAVYGYIQVISKIDPATAMEWVGQISEPTLKKDGTRSMLGIWHRKDPAAAKVWQEAHGLPEEWLSEE